jgi:hypothetical protein
MDVSVEGPVYRAGGVIVPPAELERIGAAAREHDLASYLDGARLLNAAVARGDYPAALAAPFDLAAISLSKGLGAPGGWVLAGRRTSTRSSATGGSSAGRCASPASSRPRASSRSSGTSSASPRTTPTPPDRRAARRSPRIAIDPDRVETNIVVFRTARRTRRPSSPARASAAFPSSPSGRGPSGRSRISTSTARPVGTAPRSSRPSPRARLPEPSPAPSKLSRWSCPGCPSTT